MANKIDVKLILELLQTPMSQREIIETRHISSKSITAVCRRAAELGVSFADLEDKSDDEVYLLFFLDTYRKETVYAPVNYEYVHGELISTRISLRFRPLCRRATRKALPSTSRALRCSRILHTSWRSTLIRRTSRTIRTSGLKRSTHSPFTRCCRSSLNCGD